jgi:hypothetical protein
MGAYAHGSGKSATSSHRQTLLPGDPAARCLECSGPPACDEGENGYRLRAGRDEAPSPVPCWSCGGRRGGGLQRWMSKTPEPLPDGALSPIRKLQLGGQPGGCLPRLPCSRQVPQYRQGLAVHLIQVGEFYGMYAHAGRDGSQHTALPVGEVVFIASPQGMAKDDRLAVVFVE